MSVGHARAGIREMLRLPRPARRWPRWLWIVAAAFPPALSGKLLGRLWTWILLTTVFALGLGAVPLLGVLGFELAVVTAFFAAVMGLDVGSALARQIQRLPAPGVSRATFAGRTLARSTVAASLLVAAIMVIPAVISAVRGIWLPTCDWWFGIKAYLLMPITTALLAGAVGHALGVVSGPRRFAGAAFAQLPLVLVALAALYRFYSAPAVFTYNAVLGYFPGNLYDENVKLHDALLWSRLEQVLWVIALVAMVAMRFDVPRHRFTAEPRPAGRRWGAFVIACVCVAGGLSLRGNSGRLGYDIDAEDVQEILGGRLETAHFVIHYATSDDIEEIIGLVAGDHEFRYAQVVQQLGIESSTKIHSYYFANREQKARLMGARDVEMAKPWRREIYLEHRGFPHGSLRHEIAHAVAAEFGDPLFGVAAQRVLGVPAFISPGLIEGLAVATDWPGRYDRMTPHEAVRALQAMGKKPRIGQLLSLQFFNFSSAAGYTTAGSFLRFLLEEYGAPSLRALYSNGGDFEAAYHKPLSQLEAEWVAMIAQIQLPPSAVDASRERFRQGSVFSRPCPHAIAARREQAQLALADGDRPRAVRLMRQVCGDAPEEPRHRLALAELLSEGNPFERTEAINVWTALANNAEGVTSTLRATAFENLARAAAERGDFTQVRALIADAVQLPLDADERRQIDALSFALAHTGPAGPALRGYFFGAGPGISPATYALLATLAEPTLGLGHYLLGLQMGLQGEQSKAAVNLERGIVFGLPGTPFVKNAARRLAIAAYRTGDTTRVMTAATALSGAQMTTGDRLLARDWLDRIEFDATKQLPTTSRR